VGCRHRPFAQEVTEARSEFFDPPGNAPGGFRFARELGRKYITNPAVRFMLRRITATNEIFQLFE
jgi:hypothetical protein